MNPRWLAFHLWRREIVDQWRDRRTLLSVIFLPLLLYPILGIAMLQVTQFMGERPTTVWVVGNESLETMDGELMQLFNGGNWNPELASEIQPGQTTLVFGDFQQSATRVAAQRLTEESDESPDPGKVARWRQLIQEELQQRGADVLLWINCDSVENPASTRSWPSSNVDAKLVGYRAATGVPTHWGDAQLPKSQRPEQEIEASTWRSRTVPVAWGGAPVRRDGSDEVERRGRTGDALGLTKTVIPKLYLFHNTASDQSKVAVGRVEQYLNQWYFAQQSRESEAVGQPAEPFVYSATDLAPREQVTLQIWSKILPFILFLWTLTGAFYCAVDLCAGEKERGTLEALLVTPATRAQLVLGKLLTTMAFSMTSGMVNLLGTVATGAFVTAQLAAAAPDSPWAAFGAPPLAAIGWLFIGAIPISALFSAISLAIAAFARSTKEGQHYLMPVLMICLPLLSLPMLPGVELDLGMSLLPISGLMFWLKALIEGQYGAAGRFLLPVFVVNGWCVYMAISWAVTQFQQESVLFRPVEKFSLVAWVQSLFLGKNELPTLAQVGLLMGIIFALKLTIQAVAPVPTDWHSYAIQAVALLVIAVALPPILLAKTATTSVMQTLRLRNLVPHNMWAAFGLAICFHPLILLFQQFVTKLYPVSIDTAQVQTAFSNIIGSAPGFWAIVVVMAITPAICEELAFRGFVLSGLLRASKPINAVVVTAVLFGATHGLLQQSVVATLTGLILGALAWRTASLWPCMVYHATHNSVTMMLALLDQETIMQSRFFTFVFDVEVGAEGQIVNLSYAAMPACFMLVCGIWLWMNLKDPAAIDSSGTGANRVNERSEATALVAAPSVSESSL